MPHQSYLYREIHEQPVVLEKLLSGERKTIASLAAAIRQRDVQVVLIAARGTSDNAGRYANYLLGALNGLPVALATPSLYTIYNQTPRVRNALVIGISQSGKSPDIVSVLEDARKQGALTAAITNFPESDLGSAADHVIALHAGEERSIAATKTYTSELAAVALLAATLAEDDSRLEAIARIPDSVASALEIDARVAEIAPRYRYMRDCVVIGRGYNYATAFELALKMKELTYTIAEPYSSADFVHGPLALIEYGFPAIVIAPSGAMLPEMMTFIRLLREREAEAIVISDDGAALDLGRTLAAAAGRAQWLSPLTTIVPGQLLALYLAYARLRSRPRVRLRKVTKPPDFLCRPFSVPAVVQEVQVRLIGQLRRVRSS